MQYYCAGIYEQFAYRLRVFNNFSKQYVLLDYHVGKSERVQFPDSETGSKIDSIDRFPKLLTILVQKCLFSIVRHHLQKRDSIMIRKICGVKYGVREDKIHVFISDES